MNKKLEKEYYIAGGLCIFLQLCFWVMVVFVLAIWLL